MELFPAMEFFDALVRYEVALWSALEHELSRHDQVNLGHLHALRVVDRHAGRTRVQDLSRDIGITVGAASKLVDRLERDGLIVRNPNPEDRRSSLIALTAAGQRALDSASRIVRDSIAEAFGEEDVAALTAGLQRLQTRLDRSRAVMAA